MLHLPVNVDQVGSQLGEGPHRHGAPVDARHRARDAVNEDLTRDQQRLVRLDAVGLQRGRKAPALRRREHAVHVCRPRAGAHVFGPGAAAEQQVDRVDENRLARAGLPGEDVEPRLQRKLDGVDQSQVLHPQPEQHAT